ncbi:HEPN domain-containing protein [Pseudomonas aeruginosa]
MHLSEPVIKKGFFFTPLEPNKKYPGVMTISDGGNIEVELTADDSAFTSFDDMEIGRLIGIVEGGYVTLEGCGYRKKSMSFPGLPATSYIDAKMAFVGVGLEEPGEFLSMQFGVDGLSEWWNQSAFKFDIGRDFQDFKLSVEIPPPVEFLLPDGTQFKISIDARIPGGRKFPTFEFFHQAVIQLTPPEPKPFDYFTGLSHQITRFFAFLIGNPVAIHSLSAKLNDPQLDPLHQWLQVYFRSLNNPTKKRDKPFRSLEMLLPYSSVESGLQSLLSKWLEEYENLGPALHHYYLIQDGSHRYIDTKFISMAQALEAFHRRTTEMTRWPKSEYKLKVDAIIESCPDSDKEWLKEKLNFGNEVTLADRLRNMLEPYSSVFGGEDSVANIVKQTKDTRNYHAHYDAKGARKATKGAALVALTFRLQVLFTLCIVVRLGLKVEEALNLVKTEALARLLKSANNIDENAGK